MNKKHLLWFLVAANVLLTFASVGAEGFFGWTLPPVLAAYEHEKITGFSPWTSLTEAMRLMVLCVTGLVAFAAWTGLATFWRHARGFFLFSVALDVLLRLVEGPLVTTSIGAAFRMMDLLVAGMIIGLVYYSDLARVFERPKAAQGSAAMQVGAGPA